MLNYLTIPLSGDAVSFCHYESSGACDGLISKKVLGDALLWAMKENLSVQFVLPSRVVDKYVLDEMDKIDHTLIVPSDYPDKELVKKADVVVIADREELNTYEFCRGTVYVLRTGVAEFISSVKNLAEVLPRLDRLNVVFTDMDNVDDKILGGYKEALESLIPVLEQEFAKGHMLQLNILTDRMALGSMNNCGAGDSSLAMGLDGTLYICPAFLGDETGKAGDIWNGVEIRNQQLFMLSHAPICRICDAYQCRRCVWLNKHFTLEVNTPGRQQCVMAHVERNASGKFLDIIREKDPYYMEDVRIEKLDYLDPLENFRRSKL